MMSDDEERKTIQKAMFKALDSADDIASGDELDCLDDEFHGIEDDNEVPDDAILAFDIEWDFGGDGFGQSDLKQWDLVEIGAVSIVSDHFEETIFEALVKPELRTSVSDEFTNITGITNKEISEKGQDLKSALESFFEIAGQYKRWVT